MKHQTKQDGKGKILTIPNLLSFIRICLIPVIVWSYCIREDSVLTLLILLLSGITDVADGMIARKLNMISDFGKAFDPVADKLTQIAMLFCMVTRFQYMIIPLGILVVKELIATVTGILVIRKTHHVISAVWHGKATTVLVHIMLMVHLLWLDIPVALSVGLVCICTGMMLISAVLYSVSNMKLLLQAGKNAVDPSQDSTHS